MAAVFLVADVQTKKKKEYDQNLKLFEPWFSKSFKMRRISIPLRPKPKRGLTSPRLPRDGRLRILCPIPID